MTVTQAPMQEVPDPGSDHRPDRLPAVAPVVCALAAGGVAADVALRARQPGLGLVVAVVVLAIVVVAAAPARSWSSATCATLAVLAAGGMASSTSPWVVGPDAVATVVLLALAAGFAQGPHLVRLTFPDLARRLVRPVVFAAVAPAFALGALARASDRRTARRVGRSVGHPEPERRRDQLAERRASVRRGLLLALPVVVGIALLLRAADPVFASFLVVPSSVPSVPTALGHLALLLLGAWAAATLLADAASPIVPLPRARRPLGPIEAGVVLGGLTVVYTLFAVAQVVAASGGAGHVLRTNGLTYAEYARSGFFQLLWAAGLTVVVLLGVRGATRTGSARSRWTIAAFSAVASSLTLVVVGTAIHRLAVYQAAYGATMLRLTCTVFAWWLGVVFVLLTVRVLVPGRREWLPAAVLASVVVGLAVFNALHPEALIAREDLRRARSGQRFDPAYLSHLSDDAVPTLAAAYPTLDARAQAAVIATVCRHPVAPAPGWPSANLARSRADDARRTLCGA